MTDQESVETFNEAKPVALALCTLIRQICPPDVALTALVIVVADTMLNCDYEEGKTTTDGTQAFKESVDGFIEQLRELRSEMQQ